MAFATPTELAELRPHLMRIALARMKDPHAAEDLVQEAFAAALRGGHAFAGRSRLRTWVTSILLHKVADAFRLKAREAVVVATQSRAGDVHDDADFGEDGHWIAPSAPWCDPELALSSARFRELFDASLAQLPALQSRAFFLREVMGHEPDAICAELSVTHNHLCVLLHRARLGLRRGLDRDWFRAAA